MSIHALIAQRQRQPFRWGVNDCALFAADAVRVQTGSDPAAEWRGTYATEQEAAGLIERLGGLEQIATGALGAPLNAPAQAQIGDVGLVQWHGRECLAVCQGPAWVLPSTRGLGLVPLDSARLAWRASRA